ncbi:hypothetical protein VTO42DRAFT_2001 [Malbranchea cinnamomea]
MDSLRKMASVALQLPASTLLLNWISLQTLNGWLTAYFSHIRLYFRIMTVHDDNMMGRRASMNSLFMNIKHQHHRSAQASVILLFWNNTFWYYFSLVQGN